MRRFIPAIFPWVFDGYGYERQVYWWRFKLCLVRYPDLPLRLVLLWGDGGEPELYRRIFGQHPAFPIGAQFTEPEGK